jgi:5-formyltetrahydrofolate cyclo-ligase
MAEPTKAEIRKAALAARRGLSKAALLKLSGAVARIVVSSPEYRRANVVATYVAKSDEVQTEAIIRRTLEGGRRVLVPVASPSGRSLVFSEIRSLDELASGSFGVPEPRVGMVRPVPIEEAGLTLVPLVAWDDGGRRLGYGKGYFDSALARAGASNFTMGLGLELQHVRAVPAESHDVTLMAVATESRIVRFRNGGGA